MDGKVTPAAETKDMTFSGPLKSVFPPLQQVMITMGYLFSPFVMSRLNTRPQFIAALLISAVAQVIIVLTCHHICNIN